MFGESLSLLRNTGHSVPMWMGGFVDRCLCPPQGAGKVRYLKFDGGEERILISELVNGMRWLGEGGHKAKDALLAVADDSLWMPCKQLFTTLARFTSCERFLSHLCWWWAGHLDFDIHFTALWRQVDVPRPPTNHVWGTLRQIISKHKKGRLMLRHLLTCANFRKGKLNLSYASDGVQVGSSSMRIAVIANNNSASWCALFAQCLAAKCPRARLSQLLDCV